MGSGSRKQNTHSNVSEDHGWARKRAAVFEVIGGNLFFFFLDNVYSTYRFWVTEVVSSDCTVFPKHEVAVISQTVHA